MNYWIFASTVMLFVGFGPLHEVPWFKWPVLLFVILIARCQHLAEREQL